MGGGQSPRARVTARVPAVAFRSRQWGGGGLEEPSLAASYRGARRRRGGRLGGGGGVLGLATRNRGGLRAPNNAGRTLMPRRLSVAENETPDGLRGRLGPAPWEQMSM